MGIGADQNKTLRAAANRPKDTSPRLNHATNYSAKISSAKRDNLDSETATVNLDHTTSSKRIQGSYAGLMRSASTYLQPNGAGYDNPKYQAARYANKFASVSNTISDHNSLIKNKGYSIMDNYSSQTAKGSSSDRLRSIVDNNMMFK